MKRDDKKLGLKPRVTVNFRISQSFVDTFNRSYYFTRTVFLERCMRLACNHKDFFDYVFYHDDFLGEEV